MQTKFLTDGRKVSVIGMINSTEYIVQEVFVTPEGDEIPSGEKFTTKSLHDSKIESWKDKELKRIQEEILKNEKYLEKTKEEIEKIKQEKKFESELSASLKHMAKKFNNESLETLYLFIEGRIKYVSYIDYNGPHILNIKDFLQFKEWGNHCGMKLLSLFGSTEGDLCFNLNQYRDGSGSWQEVSFHETKEGAIKKLSKDFNHLIESGGRVYIDGVEKCLQLGININTSHESFKKWREEQVENCLRSLKQINERGEKDKRYYLDKINKVKDIL